MNILYTTRTSTWSDQPSKEDLKELEYTQLEENNGNGSGNSNGNNNSNGNGNGNQNVPVNSGLVFVLLIAIFYGLWKQYRTSARSI